jgi:hypothetical protein
VASPAGAKSRLTTMGAFGVVPSMTA